MKKVAAAAVALATFVGGFSIPAANALPTQQDERTVTFDSSEITPSWDLSCRLPVPLHLESRLDTSSPQLRPTAEFASGSRRTTHRSPTATASR
ncbi:hypothetical protein CCHOA_05650 [Corynebacterium choanae]|uniref:Secreted protein n=1 Tax=Corynebacterium choanae TaxID=1862358 RepID=A0A3G6JAM6_9CORY|nr:hypothetical protein CCHOA_05650 [Corynebacterium choanae]